MSAGAKPTIRWGIIGTGLMSSWYVRDLVLDRPDGLAHHIVQAIGSSSEEKARTFVKSFLPGKNPTIYGAYDQVYADADVDVVYIATPHGCHRQNCLDAISHGKHVVCEKAFALTAAEAREVFDAARSRGVFVMEAMWTRFFPLVQTLQRLLHKEELIGEIRRVLCDYAMDQKIASLGPESRLKNPALGAGTLLETGVYTLTWGLLGLEPPLGEGPREAPKITAVQSLIDGVDTATSVILSYADGRQGILTTDNQVAVKTPPVFCRIEGREGVVYIEGPGSSSPSSFTVVRASGERKLYEFPKPGRGFIWEADSVALDISAGRKESAVMPWSETIRVMDILDEIRRQGGARFPVDKPQ